MTTIPASTVVNVTPGVLSAGGAAIFLNGLFLTTGTRVPIGTVPSFPTSTAVAAYFGAGSPEALAAATYFQGFNNATASPGAMLFAQYPLNAVSAFIRGGPSALTLAGLQALNGSMSIVVDGITRASGSINLAAATSFSNAAVILAAALNASQPQQAAFTASIASNGTLTVTALTSGTISAGLTVSGTGITGILVILSQVSGSVGGTGTYALSGGTQTVGSSGMTGIPSAVVGTFDSVSGAFVLTSTAIGAPSTVAYGTGAIATSLNFTQATGAVLSQGAAAATPVAFMTTLVTVTQNWALFTIIQNPDASGNANRLAFAQWTSTTSNRYGFVPWDADVNPQLSNQATSSLGYLVNITNAYSGTCVVWDPNGNGAALAAFVLGTAAAINFNQLNGRITFNFKSSPAGLVPGVTDPTTAANLAANGYNYFGAYATANQQFNWFGPGTVSGPFKWLDSYCNQIWMNANFQSTLINYLLSVPSIPYNPAGYAGIAAALATPITAAGNFGAFRVGVTLSGAQQTAVNNAAGRNIVAALNGQGYYLQVLDPGPVARQARQSPIVNFWYCDGEAVHQINLASQDLL